MVTKANFGKYAVSCLNFCTYFEANDNEYGDIRFIVIFGTCHEKVRFFVRRNTI